MATPTAQQTESVTWQIDPSHSLVEFSVKHMMFSTVKGRFGGVSGTIVDNPDRSKSAVDVTIDAATVDTRDERRDGHLKSPDFFDVANHPTITFKHSHIEHLGGDRLKLVGDLTIHGITKPVEIATTMNGRGTNPYGMQVAGFTGETTISRKDFDLNWNAALEAGGVLVGDTVKILLEIQAVKQS